MQMILAVALGGALGAAGRHSVGQLALKYLGDGFPYATFTVNILGGFFIGVLAALFALKWSAAIEWRAFLIVGVLGGFTTFSAYSLEVVLMIERGEWGMALGYALSSTFLAVLAVFAGLSVTRWSIL